MTNSSNNEWLQRDIQSKLMLIRARIDDIRNYNVLDNSTNHFIELAAERCDHFETKNNQGKTTEDDLEILQALHQEMTAINIALHPDTSLKVKVDSLLLLCDTLEKSPKQHHLSMTTLDLDLAQFINNSTRVALEAEMMRLRDEDQDSDLQKDLSTLYGMCATTSISYIKTLGQSNSPYQLTNMNKQFLLTIKASQDPSPTNINILKQEIKNHKRSLSETLYSATIHKLHKTIYRFLNRLALKAFNKHYTDRPLFSLKVNSANKPTFTPEGSGVKLFKKPKIHKQLNKVAQHIDQKRKTGSK